jgi:acyl-CoA reductase-like NAD-dependent aldehyde dehydrogenase
MEEGLSERLLAHHVAGRWRAPLSQRMRDVPGPDGAPLGRLVEGDARDIARLMAAAGGAGPVLGALGSAGRSAVADRFRVELIAREGLLAEARRLEGGAPPGTLEGRALPPLPPGALALLGTVAAPALVAALLAAALREGRPVILKPAPRAPLAALVIVEAARAAGAPAGAVSLVQGGGTGTGAALLAAPGIAAGLLAGKPAARDPLRRAPVPVVPVAP